MGIRIHKVLGYGLNDLQLNDDRLNLDCFDTHHDGHYFNSEFDKAHSFEHFKQFIVDRRNAELLQDGNDRCWETGWIYRDIQDNKLASFESYNVFFGLFQEFHKKNLLLVTIPWQKDWDRYDDLIDHVEQSEIYGEAKDLILNLGDAIYPYLSYRNLKTGELLKDFVILRAFNAIKFSKKIKKKDKPALLENLAKAEGFDSYLDYYNNVKPETPKPIRLLCEFYGIFKDNKTIDLLRPMLYTYWS